MAFTFLKVTYSKKKLVKLNQLNEFLEKGWKPIGFEYPFDDFSSVTVTIAKPKA